MQYPVYDMGKYGPDGVAQCLSPSLSLVSLSRAARSRCVAAGTDGV